MTTLARPNDDAVVLHEAKIDVKVRLSGLWIAVMILFAFVDILGFWRKDILNGALRGKIPGTGFAINQTFMLFSTIYIMIPTLMIVVCLLAPARFNRPANIGVGALYVATLVASSIGESWAYYVIGHAVEAVLLLVIVRIAWTWPRGSEPVQKPVFNR